MNSFARNAVVPHADLRVPWWPRSPAAAARSRRPRAAPPAGPRLYALHGLTPRLHARSYVADGASLIGDITVEECSSVWFGAVLRGDNGSIHIGARSNIQDGAVVHCLPGGQVTIGRDVSIGHLAAVHGACVADRCLIGIGAVLLDGASIGADSIVAAGSVVTGGRSYEAGTLLKGVPAQPVRRVTEREMAANLANAQQYVTRALSFRDALRRV